MRADIIIVGAGAAGLACALGIEQRSVLIVNDTAPASEVASAWAQGGVAAAVAPGDAPAFHAADTLAAAGGIADAATVRELALAAPGALAMLERYGVLFDRDDEGALDLGLEAAHSHRRIAHAADHTGATIVRALLDALAARANVRLVTGLHALDLSRRDDGAVCGVRFADAQGRVSDARAGAVVLASGGFGGLFAKTTTPLATLGAGIAIAARAGATLADLEFVQFHPTALVCGSDPMPLISEAVRGEGATLIDERGERFVDELAARDVVARAIADVEARGGNVRLDARRALGGHFEGRFPTIFARARAAGIDPCLAPLPVTAAAHYTIGGIATDARGRTDVAGLWACGEVSATGLHGANRLASNSLMEAIVFGTRVARELDAVAFPRAGIGAIETPSPVFFEDDLGRVLRPLRDAMSMGLGVVRDAPGMHAVFATAQTVERSSRDPRIADAARVACAVTQAALTRCESRGAHARRDFPETDPRQAARSFIRADAALARIS
jgi:L-aspartate oxidase